jgi:hypothetical protein
MGLGLKAKHGRIIKGGNLRISRIPKHMTSNISYGSGLSDETFSSLLNTHKPALHPYHPRINNVHGLYGPSGNG